MKKITIALVFSLFVTLFSWSATNKVAFISTYESLSALNATGDDDEIAAANWCINNYKGTFVSVSQIKGGTANLSNYTALWIAIDRVGTGAIPTEILDADVVAKLTAYYKNGGNLLLTNHATQLLVNMGRTTRVPGIRGAGSGFDNPDTWTINPVIGKIYDHSENAIFAEATSSTDFFPSVPNPTIPLIGGPGWKEDHNSMWDLNSYGYSVLEGSNTVKVFEDENNAKVLATWGQVVDFCCAGVVYFAPTTDFKGKCYAIGVAAYEWNQNSGPNLYQSNIEGITKSTLDILATPTVVQTKVGFVSTYESLSALNATGDDDEIAAANWCINIYKGSFVPVSQIKSGAVSLSNFTSLWIAVDRTGTGAIPTELMDADIISKLTTYYKNGGNLLLTNHATQLIVNLGRTTRVPGIRGAGNGFDNPDTWTINPVIGKIYDHSDDPVFAETTSSSDFFPSVPNPTIPLIGGPGWKEDHNSMWDLNSYGYSVPEGSNTVKVFEDENNAKVLATWGQVVDFCCAGIVYFTPTTEYKGKCYAIGVAAYEWNQNSATNLYQSNIENITKSTLEILASPISGVSHVTLDNVMYASIIHNKLIVNGSKENIFADLYSINGSKVNTFNTFDLINGSDVSNLNRGIYILKIYDRDGTTLSVNKLIKQ
jgi:hypothetical protein